MADAGADIRSTRIDKELSDLYGRVVQAFEAQDSRMREHAANWAMWNCELGADQNYTGRNQLYAPFVYEAVKARCTRVVNDLFPKSQRRVEVISQDGSLPRAALSVLEHYINIIDLRTIIYSTCLNGDMEGQYNIYVSWRNTAREVTYKDTKEVLLPSGIAAGEAQDIGKRQEAGGRPHIEVLADSDVAIWPFTASSLSDALAAGGFAAIKRRWTQRQIDDAVKDGIIDKKDGEQLTSELSAMTASSFLVQKEKLHMAGVRYDTAGRWAMVYEIWKELKIEEKPQLCRIFMAGHNKILSARRNPLWADLCPLISVSAEPVSGQVKGATPVTNVRPLQYYANDVLNEGADSANYSLLPLIFRDPAYATSPIVLAPAALIDIPPNSVQLSELPPLWQHTMEILSGIKQEIFQVLSVNPAMITGGAGRRPTQAEVAQEQAVDILTTHDRSEVLARRVLDPLLELIMGLDYQYRQDNLFIRQYGDTGAQHIMDSVPPFELSTRYEYRWVGAEVTQSIQRMQEKIAALNIIKAIPPQAYPGYELDLQPFILDLTETVFGARLGRRIFKDIRSQLSADPVAENDLLRIGHAVSVHAMDDHAAHIRSHRMGAGEYGDSYNAFAAHIKEHEIALMAQQQALAAAQQNASGPGAGQEGTPMEPIPGAVPESPGNIRYPPGVLHEDEIQDASRFPRNIM